MEKDGNRQDGKRQEDKTRQDMRTQDKTYARGTERETETNHKNKPRQDLQWRFTMAQGRIIRKKMKNGFVAKNGFFPKKSCFFRII